MPTVPLEIGPDVALTMRSARMVDVRNRDEREAFGWLPGTVWLPRARALSQLQAMVAKPSARPVVLTCMSGRRTVAIARELDAHARRPIFSLTGGILAWRQLGLPVCATDPTLLPSALFDPVADEPIDAGRFRRELLSCFAGAAVAAGSEDGDLEKTVATALAVFDGSRASAHLAVERLGAKAWAEGHPADLIVRNVSYFYRLAEHLI